MSAVPETGATRAAQYAFAAHIRDPEHAPAPGDVEPRRMAVYTELFYNNIESLLAANFPVIRRLHDDGLAVLLVEQNVGQSLEIADRAYVLENGALRFAGTPDELLASDELRRAYLGL